MYLLRQTQLRQIALNREECLIYTVETSFEVLLL